MLRSGGASVRGDSQDRANSISPDVPETWRQPNLDSPSEPTLSFRLRRDSLDLAFLTTITSFNAPQNVTLEELRIESYFPLDDATDVDCARLAGA